jgi:hypothetical protein
MKNNCSGIQDWFASTGEGPGFAEYWVSRKRMEKDMWGKCLYKDHL